MPRRAATSNTKSCPPADVAGDEPAVVVDVEAADRLATVAIWRQHHLDLTGARVALVNGAGPQAADEERRAIITFGDALGKDVVTCERVAVHGEAW